MASAEGGYPLALCSLRPLWCFAKCPAMPTLKPIQDVPTTSSRAGGEND